MNQILINLLAILLTNNSIYSITTNNIQPNILIKDSLSTISLKTELFDEVVKHAQDNIPELKKAVDTKDLARIKNITDTFLIKAYTVSEDDVDAKPQLTQLYIVIRNYEFLYRFARDGKVESIENAYISIVNSTNELLNLINKTQ